MKGWKTWVAAIGAFCAGAAMVAAGMTSEPVDTEKVYQGIMACIAAFGLVGIGHKIEKSK